MLLIPSWLVLLWSPGLAATAVGPGGEGGSPKRPYKAPTDNTKPQKDYTKPQQTIQRHKILDKDL